MAEPLRGQFAGASPSRPGGGFVAWIFGGPVSGDELRRARNWLTVAGVLAIVTGIIAIAVPIIASVATAIFVGWVLLAAGIVMGINAFSNRAPLRALEALLTLIAGLYLLIFPLSGTVTLTFVLAVWFFATGVLYVTVAAGQRGDPNAWIIGLNGILSVILGVLVAASLPSSASWAIGLLVGINLIFWGVRALIAARLMKTLLGN
jgi:uncharacterized membrane protein HdeD (DUF308 family)